MGWPWDPKELGVVVRVQVDETGGDHRSGHVDLWFAGSSSGPTLAMCPSRNPTSVARQEPRSVDHRASDQPPHRASVRSPVPVKVGGPGWRNSSLVAPAQLFDLVGRQFGQGPLSPDLGFGPRGISVRVVALEHDVADSDLVPQLQGRSQVITENQVPPQNVRGMGGIRPRAWPVAEWSMT